VRACTRLTEAAKALATRDHVRGISGPSALSNRLATNVVSGAAYSDLEHPCADLPSAGYRTSYHRSRTRTEAPGVPYRPCAEVLVC
jgi:hypothetical protein